MAKEAPKKAETVVDAAPPKKSRMKLIIVGLVVVLVLAATGVTAMLVLQKKSHGAGEGDEEVAAEPMEAPNFDPRKPPIFVPMEAFTVNLQPENGDQVLQLYATLRVADEKIGEQVKVFMPQIRHEMLSLLAAKLPSEITTPEGRESLADEMRGTINSILGWEPPKKKKVGKQADAAAPKGPVVAVFFTQFIVQ